MANESDAIQQKLIETRKRAATKFKSAYGNTFGRGTELFRILGTDKNGFVLLQNLQTGKQTSVDPINFVYANPSTLTSPQSSGGLGIDGGGGGGGFQSLLSTAGTVGGLVGQMQQAGAVKEQTKQMQAKGVENWEVFFGSPDDNHLQNLYGTHPELKGIPEVDKALKNVVSKFGDLQNATESLTKLQAARLENVEIPSVGLSLDILKIKTENTSLINQYFTDIPRIKARLDTLNAQSPDSARLLNQTLKDGRFSSLWDEKMAAFKFPTRSKEELTALVRQIEDDYDNLVKHKIETLEAQIRDLELRADPNKLAMNKAQLDVARAELAYNKAVRDGKKVIDPKAAYLEEVRRTNEARSDFQRDYRNAKIKLGGAVVGGATSGYYLYDTVFDMARNGLSMKGMLGAAGSVVGLYTSLKVMQSALMNTFGNQLYSGRLIEQMADWPIIGKYLPQALKFISSPQGFAVAAAAIAALAIILGRRKKSAEEEALEELVEETEPVVWHNGPVLALSAGLTMAAMGINLGPTAPSMQSVLVPQIQLNAVLGEAPAGPERYSTVFVQQGTGGEATRVVYLTPGGVDASGNRRDRVNVVTLAGDVKFTNPGESGGYIPFFAPNSAGRLKPNPLAVGALAQQENLLDAAGSLNARSAQTAAVRASGSNKDNTTAP